MAKSAHKRNTNTAKSIPCRRKTWRIINLIYGANTLGFFGKYASRRRHLGRICYLLHVSRRAESAHRAQPHTVRDIWFRLLALAHAPHLSPLFLWRLYGRHYAVARGYWIDSLTRHVFHYSTRHWPRSSATPRRDVVSVFA